MAGIAFLCVPAARGTHRNALIAILVPTVAQPEPTVPARMLDDPESRDHRAEVPAETLFGGNLGPSLIFAPCTP
jgi:hypothetical protein